MPDIAPNAVLIDFAQSIEDPRIAFVGEKLAQECGVARDITHLDQVPDQSMLARLTGQYMQIIANQAPIGFEEEFMNPRGATIAYRGMLLPFAEVERADPLCPWRRQLKKSRRCVAERAIGARFNASFHEDGELPRLTPEQTVAQWAAWADGPQAAAMRASLCRLADGGASLGPDRRDQPGTPASGALCRDWAGL
jgi:hypothetical protein